MENNIEHLPDQLFLYNPGLQVLFVSLFVVMRD